MTKTITPPAQSDEKLTLGISLAAIQVLAFFGFVYACAFHTRALAADPFSLGLPLSFLLGLLVILCGAVLTTVYVLVTNHGQEG